MKRIKVKKIFYLIFLAIFVTATLAACDNINDNSNYNNNSNCERIFLDDRVIAILTDEAAENVNEYTAESFAEIGAVSIEIYFDNIIFITIDSAGKENVLRAVEILSARPDIKEATPEYLEYPVDE